MPKPSDLLGKAGAGGNTAQPAKQYKVTPDKADDKPDPKAPTGQRQPKSHQGGAPSGGHVTPTNVRPKV